MHGKEMRTALSSEVDSVLSNENTFRPWVDSWFSTSVLGDRRLTRGTSIGILSLAVNAVNYPISHHKIHLSRGGVWTSKWFLMSFSNTGLHVSISLLISKQKPLRLSKQTHTSLLSGYFSNRIIILEAFIRSLQTWGKKCQYCHCNLSLWA